MDTFVATTFIIIVSFSLLNMLLSLTIYFSSKRSLYLRTGIFWLSLIVNFLIQSQSQANEMSIIFGFGFTIIPLNLLSYASLFFCDLPYPRKLFVSLSLLSTLLTVTLIDQNISFTWKAMPFAFSGAVPLLYTVYAFMTQSRNKKTPLMRVHAGVLLLLAIHSFNFAFFRMQPEAQLWGWPVAYGLYQLLAVLIPALALDFYHREEQNRLNNIIDLKTKDLTAKNQMLQNLAQEKTFLYRTLTHDISNPLLVISARLEMAKAGMMAPEKLFSTVALMTERMTKLIHQIRRFETELKNSSELKTTEVNLLECVLEVQAVFEDRLKEKDVRLVYDKKNMAQCMVIADRDSFINSVLSNIISNSIKFSHPGGQIELEIQKSEPGSEAGPDNQSVLLSVRDHGIGIPKKILERLFEFDSKTSRPGTSGEPGTGFGVPILEKIIKAYGGQLRITSSEKSATEPGYTLVEMKLTGKILDNVLANIA